MKQVNKIMSVELIKGKSHSDDRGTVTFNNDFDMTEIKRMYVIKNKNVNIFRAWQAHKIEEKYFKCIRGSVKIMVVKLDNFSSPSRELIPSIFILKSQNNEILKVPGGYANGIQSVEKDSELLVFSNLDLESAKEDQYSFNHTWESNLPHSNHV